LHASRAFIKACTSMLFKLKAFMSHTSL
jgi:hypothetical protein